jgi:ubiquinone/menaquinone biosynthesis C-methylase UbiE
MRQSLREVRRVLRPGGVLFLTSVNRHALDCFRSFYQLKRFLIGGRASVKAPHCEFVTPAEISKELMDAGFSSNTNHGRMLGPMRIFYRVLPPIARASAPFLEPFDDAICASSWTTPYAGHLVSVATR